MIKRAPLLVNDVDAWAARARVEQQVVSGEPAKSVLFAPMLVGDDVRGHISLQNIDRTDAFTEADVRLLTTLASQPAASPSRTPGCSTRRSGC